MPDSTPVSIAICRVAAVLFVLFAAFFLALATLLFPPILEAYVLVDGELGSLIKSAIAAIASLGILGVGIGFLVGAVRLWSRAPGFAERRVQLVLMAVIFTSCIVIVLLELTTRIAVAPSAYLSGNDFWIHRFVEAKKAEPGDKGALESEASVDRFDPELGWAPRENYRSEDVNVNSRGARGLREDPDVAPAGTKRIVIIGDSFSFGEGVADADTYPRILESMLENVRVINLGVLGFGTDQQLLRMKRSAFEYNPDLIILGFFGPNSDRNVLSFRDAPKPMFKLADEGLELVNSPVPGPEIEWDFELPWLRSASWLGTLMGQVIDRTRFAPKWEVTRRILTNIHDACQENGVPLMVAFYPKKHLSFVKTPTDTETVVGRWADERSVHFFSVRPAFSKLAQKQRVKIYWGHWTRYGNRFVATQLARELETTVY